MSSLPTPNSLPVDTYAHRLAVGALRELAYKKRAVDAALNRVTVFEPTLKSPFEDNISTITNTVLARKLRTLSVSAGRANSALLQMKTATEKASRLLNTFCAEYADLIEAVDDHDYGKYAILMFPILHNCSSKATEILPREARSEKRPRGCLPPFYADEACFRRALHADRVLPEDPATKISSGEGNKLESTAKITTGQPSQPQQPSSTVQRPVAVHKAEPAVNAGRKTVTDPSQQSAAAQQISSFSSSPTVGIHRPVSQLQSSHVTKVAARKAIDPVVSSSRLVSQQHIEPLAVASKVTAHQTAPLPNPNLNRIEEDVFGYNDELCLKKTAVNTTIVSSAAAAARSAQMDSIWRIDTVIGNAYDSATPSRQPKTARRVRSLMFRRLSTAKPTLPLPSRLTVSQ
ncbi:unnamed protein product [Tilletia controversa]|uniref:Uncharacterized protein n=3 Tax=Tilletia TaxID=13289 RepID=A0A8X7MQA8_9BASI|nr:hypothetical protein CF335_g7246 [Tilletia laevis]KAE8188206.1 hypothetical protein CF328_g6675 [Tilletia controversa]KAE8246593.1 hypothetical protein A4X03_0g7239 [Tilletia caries]KAE8192544.1 hypothetical protein CF336_g4385 [Tilletia laevis]KAE8243385.1 hypothetical protein A4X06_0g6355 [Tilletia controversa]